LNENKKGLGRQIMRLIVRTSVALAAVVTVFCAAGSPITEAQQKSNVIVIMSDDVGGGDLGAYGGETRGAPTPNLDREPVQRDVEKYPNIPTIPASASIGADLPVSIKPNLVPVQK
jgi:hypothetical protein